MTSPASGSDDPASRAFNRLAEPVRRWIWRKGWTGLRDVQERAIPAILESDDDVVIAAATAGGKTEAAFLPLISRLLTDRRGGGFDLIYVGPLKALINDQFRRMEDLCDAMEIPVTPWHGDIAASVKAKARKAPGGVLLITPESLEALFLRRGLEVPRLFAGAEAVVVDELHALLDSERGVHLRSLLARLEIAVGRRIRRIGLSATLGDMKLVNAYLRPEAPDAVRQIVSASEGRELRMQLRAYVVDPPEPEARGAARTEPPDPALAAKRAVTEHLFEKLRGTNNLVFAGSRGAVEFYADALRQRCEDARLPNEFHPHHASLSRERRSFVEERLKEGRLPTTAICTSTLELGVDIGDVACVGQIGAPWSVASLRQRLGRSGRRDAAAAVLRMYAIEPRIDARSDLADRLHLGLARSIAMLELLIEGWCEPPRAGALHLSTLTHQILSVVAERGGVSAKRLYATLCDRGPFHAVDPATFAALLRQLGAPETGLIEQAPDGLLLLGPEGERQVESHRFYAVFQTPEEYRVVAESGTLGTLPVDFPLAPGVTIVFAGRRWRVEAIHEREKVIEVAPDRSGKPPPFGGGVGEIHDAVAARMRRVLAGAESFAYLDTAAARLLEEAREAFLHFGLDRTDIVAPEADQRFLATWAGTAANGSLGLILNARGFTIRQADGMIEVQGTAAALRNLPSELEAIARGAADLDDELLSVLEVPVAEKFHPFLGGELLMRDALSRRIDLGAAQGVAERLVSHLG